jgi:membrane protease subunit HflC
LRRTLLGSALTALILLGLVTSVIFVDETEYVLIERLGNIVAVYDRPEDRGLHVKAPWPIDTVRRFDRRVQLFDPPGRELFTRDKKNVMLDAYVCWKIAEPVDDSGAERPVVQFFRSLGSADSAEARLDSRMRSILSTQLGQVELSRLLSTANSESGPGDDGPGMLAQLSEQVRRQVNQRSGEEQSLRERLGIEIVDLRIKRLNLPEGNQMAVFERMRSERKKIADRYRSAGMAENRMIRSQADRQYNEILAKARSEAERIRGEAEAEAIRILNQAHALDPEFYRVLQTLDTYRKIVNPKTTLVLSASSELLKLLTAGVPELPEPPPPPSAAPSPGEKVSQRASAETAEQEARP